MRISIAVAVCIGLGVGLGYWHGPLGLEMLSGVERLSDFCGFAMVVLVCATLSYFELPRWGYVVLPLVLFVLFSAVLWTIFEPRFHLNFQGNGMKCMMRTAPAALLTAAFAHFVLRLRPLLSTALLGAVAAIIAQTICCPIVESRHLVFFHSSQLLLWPVMLYFASGGNPIARKTNPYSTATSRNFS